MRYLAVTAALCLVLAAAGAPPIMAQEDSPDVLLADANRKFERGDFQGAALGFEAFLAGSPERYEVLYKLARSYHEIDEASGFEKALRRLLAVEPGRPGTFVLMGRRYQWEGRFPDAEQAYRRALDLAPNDVDALSGLADVCLAHGDRQEGLGYLEQIVAEHPRSVPYLWMLARSADDRQRQEDLFRQILEVSPDEDVVARGRLALLEARGGLSFLQVEGLEKPRRIRLFYTPTRRAGSKASFKFQEESTGAVEGWARRVATPNTPYIRVRVNGAGPYKFIVDTGTQGVHISRALARSLKLESYGKSRFEGLGGGSVLFGEVVFLDNLEMGEVTVRNIPAEAIDLIGIGDGILNPAVLRDVRVQLENSRKPP
jgi:tetratricopeptide (TPR) repeat protein